MRALRTGAATVLMLFVIGARSRAGDNDARAECSFNPRLFRSAAMVFHELSERAELVVPSIRQRVVVPPAPPPLTFTAKNFIDNEIFGKMVKDNVRWTSASTDEEFLRRIRSEEHTSELPVTAT